MSTYELPMLPGNRFANFLELEHAVAMLHSLGEGLTANLVENSEKLEMENYRPLVVTDFASINDAAVLLIPPGTHFLPCQILQSTQRFIIGLPDEGKQKPILILTGTDTEDFCNLDTGNSTTLQRCAAELAKFCNVHLDAQLPTIMEMYIPSQRFSDHLLYVECSSNIDIYNLATYTLRESHLWAQNAYGESMCRSLNCLEKAIDQCQETSLGIVDAAFKPLVDFGRRVDKALGLR